MGVLRPAEWQSSIYAIDLAALQQRGIRGLIVDLDNTLVGWNHPTPSQALRDWLEQVRSRGLQVVIVSNNNGDRVGVFAKDLGIPYVSKARKPTQKGFRQALQLMGLEPSQVAVVGDQIFTDVFGGNRQGLYTILVVPINSREFIGTRVVRQVERFVLGYLTRRGLQRP